jgi:hypothetical protein
MVCHLSILIWLDDCNDLLLNLRQTKMEETPTENPQISSQSEYPISRQATSNSLQLERGSYVSYKWASAGAYRAVRVW